MTQRLCETTQRIREKVPRARILGARRRFVRLHQEPHFSRVTHLPAPGAMARTLTLDVRFPLLRWSLQTVCFPEPLRSNSTPAGAGLDQS
jgi:hypothetical protein